MAQRSTRRTTNVAAQAELKAQNDELTALNDALKAKDTEAQNTIAALDHLREANAEHISALMLKIDELEAGNRADKTSLAQTKDEVEALKRDITGYVEEEQKNRRDITRLREEKGAIDAELATLKGAASSNGDEKQRLQQSIDTLEGDKEVLQNEINQLLSHKRTLEDFKGTLEAKIVNLTTEIEVLRKDFNVMKQENEDLEADNQRVNKEARDLKEQVQGLQSKLDASAANLDASAANPEFADKVKLEAEIAELKEAKASLLQRLRKSGFQANCTRNWLNNAGVHAAKKFYKYEKTSDLIGRFNADAKKDADGPEGKYAKIITELIEKKKLDKPRGNIDEVFVMDATAMRDTVTRELKKLLKKNKDQMHRLADTVFPYLDEDTGSLNDLCALFSEAIVPSTGRNADSISNMMIYMWYIVTQPVTLKGLKKRSEGTPSAAGSVPARKYGELEVRTWRAAEFLDEEHAADYIKTEEAIAKNAADTKKLLYKVEAIAKNGKEILRPITESEVLRKVSEQKKNGETPSKEDQEITDLLKKRKKLQRKRGEYLDDLFEAEQSAQKRQKTEVTAVRANDVRGNPDGACAPAAARPMEVEDQSGSDVQPAAVYANAANRMSAGPSGPSDPDAAEVMAVDGAEQLPPPVQDVLPAQSIGSPLTPGTPVRGDDGLDGYLGLD